MAEIVSYGDHERKIGLLESIILELENILSEIKHLSFFTKLTILFAIFFAIFAISTSGKILSYINYASNNDIQVGKVLPPNCHLAVDFSSCGKETNCSPPPQVICDSK